MAFLKNCAVFFQDHYKTLSPEPESLTPLFSGQDEQRIPRLDSFITTDPIESPTPSLPARPVAKRGQASKQQGTVAVPPSVPETDPFDDFDFPVSTNFDTSFSDVKRQQHPPVKSNPIDPFLNSHHEQEIEDDAISFPSLPDPPPAASNARGEKSLDSHPPPPTPPSESTFYNATPTSLLAPLQVEKPKVNKETSIKKKKKKRSKVKKSSKQELSEDDDIAAEDQERNDSHNSDMPLPQRSDSTPQPSSESGMRFDELYRLRGVVSEHV